MQDPLIPVAVVGIAVDDPAQASRVKRVVGIAAFMMLWTVVSQAYMFSLVHSLGGLLSGLAFGGCVPACGYFGAKQRSKPLVGLFTCCNCCAMLSLGSYIVLTFIALAVFNADVNINGEHQSLKHLINTALPEMQACCKQLDACDFEAAGCGAAAAVCHIAALDAEMLPSTDPSTDPACLHQNVTSAAAFSTDNAFLGELDGSSAGTPGVFCVDGNTCKGIDSVDPSFKFSNGLFYILIVLLALACTPATLGCCWGKSLYDSPMMNGAPVGGYVAYPAATVQATTAYGGRATGGGYK